MIQTECWDSSASECIVWGLTNFGSEHMAVRTQENLSTAEAATSFAS